MGVKNLKFLVELVVANLTLTLRPLLSRKTFEIRLLRRALACRYIGTPFGYMNRSGKFCFLPMKAL